MAAEDVERIRRLTGNDDAFSDLEIQGMIDAGLAEREIVAHIWEAKAARTADLTDVTESGSSRSLSQIHRNAVSMAQRYATTEVEVTGPVKTTRRAVRE